MVAIAEILKEKKLKVTPQRIAIYNLLSNTTIHPSADTIYKKLVSVHPAMSLATVYKTLDTFKSVGLVQELNVGEESFRYDANYTKHPHFLCNKCHGVFDLPTIDNLEQIRDSLCEQTGHDFQSEQVYFYGICKSCIDDNTSL